MPRACSIVGAAAISTSPLSHQLVIREPQGACLPTIGIGSCSPWQQSCGRLHVCGEQDECGARRCGAVPQRTVCRQARRMCV